MPRWLIPLMGLCGILAAQAHTLEATAGESPASAAHPVKVDLGLFPALFYTPDTGLGGGLGGSITWRDTLTTPRERPNSLSGILFYTAKNQTILFMQPRLYAGHRWLVQSDFSYRKFPFVTYGIGNDTDLAAEEEYTTETFEIGPAVLYRINPRLSIGASLQFRKLAVLEYEDDGFVAGRMRAGQPPQRGYASGFGPLLEWDSRDNLFASERGQFLQVGHRRFHEAFGSDIDFEEYLVDARQFLPLGRGHSLAFQVIGVRRSGSFFFTDYASLSEIQRGIPVSRYQDRMMVMAQAEWRLPISRRFSAMLFAAGGQVAADWDGLRASDTHPSAGGGIRYALNPQERIRIRIDLGVGAEGSQVYFQFSEAF
jgi:hypothetical protein